MELRNWQIDRYIMETSQFYFHYHLLASSRARTNTIPFAPVVGSLEEESWAGVGVTCFLFHCPGRHCGVEGRGLCLFAVFLRAKLVSLFGGKERWCSGHYSACLPNSVLAAIAGSGLSQNVHIRHLQLRDLSNE